MKYVKLITLIVVVAIASISVFLGVAYVVGARYLDAMKHAPVPYRQAVKEWTA